ncbi:MAG: hypothetical protein JWN95_1166, partial [Frankiales bacterium]|nr:hypothetical protein [Frankiales bacterium]
SSLNFVHGQTVANLAIARMGTDGNVVLYNGSAGTVQLLADISGYMPGVAAPLELTAQIQHMDAHDGGIIQVGDTFFEYGTSYDCGFQFQTEGTHFCGVNVYSSRDLVEWKALGQAFDADTADWQDACVPGGCFRPHVVFDRATQHYVMWVNVFSGSYRVLTSTTPYGPWILKVGAGAVSSPSGDENFFVDIDGTAYLIRTDIRGKVATSQSHELEIDQLDSTYMNVVTAASRPTVGFVEAPTLWRHGLTYYLLYSDPACPYCTGTGTSVTTAPSPSGPWSPPYKITERSCGGQPTNVTATTVGDLYQSDRWVRPNPRVIERNQAAATQAMSPLVYDGIRVEPVRCPT